MLLLTSTSDLVQVVTGAAADIEVHASYMDNNGGTITPGRTNTPSIVTATTTTVVPAPASGVQRNVKHLNIANNSTTVSSSVAVVQTDGANPTELIAVVLLPGETLVLDATGKWTHRDANGADYAATPPGVFLQRTVLTSGTSFTTGTRTRRIVVRLVGGGGGGGGANTAATSGAAGSGGGSGGYCERVFDVQPSTAYTYAIGAAGTAGAAAGGTGGTGGNTTFTVGGTTVTASGGVGGPGMTPAAATALTLAGGAGGAATNGDVNAPGQPGIGGNRVNATILQSGNGGNSQYGGGGIGRVAQSAGAAGTGFGAGGSGGCCVNGGAAAAGGAGTAGVIIVKEYT